MKPSRNPKRAVALSTGSLFTYEIDRVYALAAQTGYDGMEVLIDGRPESFDPGYLTELMRKYGLPVFVVHSPFLPLVPGWPRDRLERLKRSVDLAVQLEAGTVVEHLPVKNPYIGRLRLPGNRRLPIIAPWSKRNEYYRFLAAGRLSELEDASGVTVALENMPSRRILGIRRNIFWFNRTNELARFAHVTLDTTHLGTWKLDPVRIYDRLKDRVFHVHLSDYDGREHRAPQQGFLKLERFLHKLVQNDYQGVVTLECSPDALEHWDERRCIANLEKALSFCSEHLSVSPQAG